MSDDADFAAHAVDLREVRGQTVALINDWTRQIEIWIRLKQQALDAGNQDRATRISQLITDCEMNVRQGEHRLQAVQRLIDAEKSATSI